MFIYKYTVEFAELFTAASLTGHIPGIMRLDCGGNMKKPRKYGLKNLIGHVGILSLRAE